MFIKKKEKKGENMGDILPKLLTYAFVIVVYSFIYTIIRMIFLDIRTMSRKKHIVSEEACLKVIQKPSDADFDVESSYALENDNRIGRSRKCNIRIDDDALSGVHCRIYKADGAFFVEDADSENGTFLNGEDVSDEVVELIDGDKLSVGSMMFLFVKSED